ncbi:MAG: gliding motility-associated C-terminal domain-containing protein [Saprospiraceae bacterium]|nr:gliding motility-associated C-terminal domain-containing protein [Saprospiraceae bacterium]
MKVETYLYRLIFSFIVVTFCFNNSAYATHNRAGEITYVQTGPLTIIATITTYTKTSSVHADRDSLEMQWGDGTSEWIHRSNGNGEIHPGDIKKNLYTKEHTYPGRGHYVMSMTDPNRNGNILNVNPPNSDNVPFYIQTTVTFLNQQFQGTNHSPVLLQPPLDDGCVGQPFIHNPNAYDIDGDSLAYRLIVPMQGINSNVPNYTFPNQIQPSIENNITFDEHNGNFTWISPQAVGEYNIAMFIIEYRDGLPLDTLIRDMQIDIQNCVNLPPVIETIDEICVIAGDTIQFNIEAYDPDDIQKVQLTALGGPFVVTVSPAVFSGSGLYENDPIDETFTWATTCEHISDEYYYVVFKAQDDYFYNVSGLATLKTVKIKVVGPQPKEVQGEAFENNIKVSWESPYICENAQDDYFYGFSVWRKIGSNPFEVDTCVTGLLGKGYTKIAFSSQMMIENGVYTYNDNNVERGKTYCYRILAEFAKRSSGGYPYNKVESLASDEICVQLKRDLPIITNVSVENTDNLVGKMLIMCSKPIATDLDTILNPPPYRYQLLRATSQDPTNFVEVVDQNFISNSYAQANDTIFHDANLNTLGVQYLYKIAFYSNDLETPLGFTQNASSVFLSIVSTDKQNILNWEANVPWENYQYVIFRKNDVTNLFDSLTISNQPTYRDQNLVNGQNYCYYIKTIGTYGINNVIDPIINLSQIACGIPIDTVAPCANHLEVSNDCGQASTTEFQNINNLAWTDPFINCDGTNDIIEFRVYYAANESSDFKVIDSLEGKNIFAYEHLLQDGLAGCYYITSIDSVRNESLPSNIVCVDNCPIYSLPNTITPNGDGANDVFIPYPYRFISSVNFRLFNRWGELIFETKDPNINWKGTTMDGKEVPDGTYYYTCEVIEQRLSGLTPQKNILNGFIEVLRNKK